MKFLKKIVWSILGFFGIASSINLLLLSHLKDKGWYKSFKTKTSIDEDGNPIPWCTYAFNQFIAQRLKSSFDVFEYGCGGSTLWYADRVKSITAVEHHDGWYKDMTAKVPDNTTLILAPKHEEYAVASTGLYDIIIVDGINRNDCVTHAINQLKEGGVLIIDNADRDIYDPSYQLLAKDGFKRLDFWGMVPIVTTTSCTAIFYKANNCLEI